MAFSSTTAALAPDSNFVNDRPGPVAFERCVLHHVSCCADDGSLLMHIDAYDTIAHAELRSAAMPR